MLKQKLTALLSGYQLLLSHSKPSLKLHWPQEIKGLVKRGKKLLSKQSVWRLLPLKIRPRQIHQLLHLPLVVLTLLVYLFASPLASASIKRPEQIIPEIRPALIKIQDSVQATALPVFQAPLHGYISTYYSSYHQGIDIPAPYGTPVKTVSSGEVVFAGWSALGYGQLIVIRHQEGFETLYAHLSTIGVRVGQKVGSGEVIGGIGNSGHATGSHLHLELHFSGATVNPLNYIKP